MERQLKKYSYRKGALPEQDQEFQQASAYGAVRLGERYVFWKRGFRWYLVELGEVSRAYRRVEAVDTKMCCGNVNFDIQKLVLLLEDGSSLELLIGEGMPREAEALFQEMRGRCPGIQYGKPKA